MTITLLELYNDIASQAWSRYDSDVESTDDFEKGLLTSIQKALMFIWQSYQFPFKIKSKTFNTSVGKSGYKMPDGEIIKKTIDGKEFYSVKYNDKFLHYLSDYEKLENKSGEPKGFYIYNDKMFLYPTPDATYSIDIEYNTLYMGSNSSGDYIYELSNDSDILSVPDKFLPLFKNALMPLALAYSISDTTDANYVDYMNQYKRAFSILVANCSGIKVPKKVVF